MKIMMNFILLIVLFFHTKELAPAIPEKSEIVIIKRPEMDTTQMTINDLHVLHPAFRNKVITLIYECKKKGITLKVVETYRTHERQDQLKRRKLSNLSGGCSKHQHFIAVDVVPVVKGIPRWHDRKLWKEIGKIGKEQGLSWGGDWRKLYDPGHFEYPISINEVKYLEIPDTVIVPLNY